MATGRNPFQRESAPAAIVAILNEAPQLPDELPIELRGIIYHALSKDAVTRYATCGEVLATSKHFAAIWIPACRRSARRELRRHSRRVSNARRCRCWGRRRVREEESCG